MLRQLLLLSLLTVFFACADTAPQPEETVAPETIAVPEAQDVPKAPTAPKVDAELPNLPEAVETEPELIDATPQPTAVRATSAKPKITPVKTASPKATTPETTTAPPPPAPKATSTAPAAAPTPLNIKITTEAPPSAPAPPKAPAKPNHTAFNNLLGKYVNSAGNVNYAAFKKDEAKLDNYLDELSKNSPQSDWSRNESMAFWINAYNANTLKLILKNYPVNSITDLHSGKPWDVKWIKIGDETYSLNNIEHDIIRPRYKDARIHFAVNCAAASCPPLPNKAFTATNLNSLLESRTRSFIRNESYNAISGEAATVSKIFDWYGEDFGDLREFLNQYATTEISAATEIGFKEYDWALNKQ